MAHEIDEQTSRWSGEASYETAHNQAITGVESEIMSLQRISDDMKLINGQQLKQTRFYWDTSDKRSWLGKTFIGDLGRNLGLYDYPFTIKVTLTEQMRVGGAQMSVEVISNP